jgi:hypothetical protein
MARQFRFEATVENIPHKNVPVGTGACGNVSSVWTKGALGPSLRRLEFRVAQCMNGGTRANVHNLETRVHGVRQHLCAVGWIERDRGDPAFVYC